MEEVTLAEVAEKEGLTKQGLAVRIKTFYKEKWPPVTRTIGLKMFFDKELVEKCLKENPYIKKSGGGRKREKRAVCVGAFTNKPVTKKIPSVDKKYANWLAGNISAEQKERLMLMHNKLCNGKTKVKSVKLKGIWNDK